MRLPGRGTVTRHSLRTRAARTKSRKFSICGGIEKAFPPKNLARFPGGGKAVPFQPWQCTLNNSGCRKGVYSPPLTAVLGNRTSIRVEEQCSRPPRAQWEKKARNSTPSFEFLPHVFRSTSEECDSLAVNSQCDFERSRGPFWKNRRPHNHLRIWEVWLS